MSRPDGWAIPVHALPAWSSLSDVLSKSAGVIPCQDTDTWLSDDQGVRAEAVQACGPCPVLTECGRYADQAAEGFGVLGRRRPDRTAQSAQKPAGGMTEPIHCGMTETIHAPKCRRPGATATDGGQHSRCRECGAITTDRTNQQENQL